MPSEFRSVVGRILAILGISDPAEIAARKRADSIRKQKSAERSRSSQPPEQTNIERERLKPPPRP